MLWMQMRSGMATSSNCMTTNEPGMPGCEPTRCRAWRIVYGLKSLPFTRLTKVRQSAGEKVSSGPAGFLESPYGHDVREVPSYLDALAVRAAVCSWTTGHS